MSRRLDEIRRRLDAATPGRWERRDDHGNHWGMREVVGPGVGGRLLIGFTTATNVSASEAAVVEGNADLIARAPDDLRHLLAEVERLRALVRRGFDGEDETGRACCPWCHVYLGGDWSAGGHADDCAAMAALGGDDA